MIRLVREGVPVGKARARKGKAGQWYTPKKTRDAEEEWQWLFIKEFNDQQFPLYPADVPLAVTITAYMKDPMKKPDIDNITKLIFDALEGFAYPNDKQIVQLQAHKEPGKPRTKVLIEGLVPTEAEGILE